MFSELRRAIIFIQLIFKNNSFIVFYCKAYTNPRLPLSLIKLLVRYNVFKPSISDLDINFKRLKKLAYAFCAYFVYGMFSFSRTE